MSPDDVRRIAYDPASFETFYRENVEAIQRFLVRRVRDPHLVADLTADVFLAAVDAAATYSRERGAPRAWLFGIARTVIASESRHRARERRAVRQIEGRTLLDSDDVARVNDRIDAAEQARSLYPLLDLLPRGERAMFELVALDELSATEAAAVLGIRPAAARVRLHRARKKLRRQLVLPHSTSPSLEATP